MPELTSSKMSFFPYILKLYLGLFYLGYICELFFRGKSHNLLHRTWLFLSSDFPKVFFACLRLDVRIFWLAKKKTVTELDEFGANVSSSHDRDILL